MQLLDSYANADETYLNLVRRIIHFGDKRMDRTGVGTRSLFAEQMKFPLSHSFPLLTTKKLHWKSVAHELLWIMSGSTNVKDLQKYGVTIWDEWADEDGDLGPVYGKQWRFWGPVASDALKPGDLVPPPRNLASANYLYEIDQLRGLIYDLKTNPYSRRHVISAWNVGDIQYMALPPCHCLFQFWVQSSDNSLHCQLYQRSADVGLGVPFNIASYALLTCILADTLGFERGSFTWSGGDVHIYENHVDALVEQLGRTSLPSPTLKKIHGQDPLAVKYEDLVLLNYKAHPNIKMDVAV